jgi:hypothetical protein
VSGQSPLSINDERRFEALSVLENLQRVTRFMMLQHPLEAEEMAAVVPEVIDVLQAGNGAVKLIDRHGRTDFIVVQQGQRRTLKELPKDFAGKVTEARIEVAEPILRLQLDSLAKRLLQLDPKLHAMAEVPSLINALAAYDEQEDRVIADLTLLTNVINFGLPSEGWSDPELIRQCYENSLDSIGDAFVRMVLPGDVAADARATAFLLANSPDPGIIIDAVTPGARALLGLPPEKPIMSVLSPGMIVKAMNSFWGTGCDISWRISRGLQRYAEETLRGADEADDFFQFHQLLHLGFLSYRTSQFLLDAALDARGGDRCAVDLVDVRNRRDISEEKRVIIANALLASAVDRPSSPNLTRFMEWEKWLAALRFLPLSAALNDIDDHYLRLLFPERIRKIAETCTRLDHAPSDRKILDRAMRTAKSISMTPSDTGQFPVQVASLGVRITRELRRTGSADTASEWARMGGPDMDTLNETLSALEAYKPPPSL